MAECSENQESNQVSDAEKQYLLTEYQAAQEMACHYDKMNWTIGTILIAATFAMVGLVGDKFHMYPSLAGLSFVSLGIWRLYYERHKKIQDVKWERLQEIEKILGLRQHIAVREADKNGMARGLIRGNACATYLTIAIPATLLVIWWVS